MQKLGFYVPKSEISNEVFEKIENTQFLNHQKYSIAFDRLPNGKVVCILEKENWTLKNIDVMVLTDFIFTENGLKNPFSMTYDEKSKNLVIGKYGLAGGMKRFLKEIEGASKGAAKALWDISTGDDSYSRYVDHNIAKGEAERVALLRQQIVNASLQTLGEYSLEDLLYFASHQKTGDLYYLIALKLPEGDSAKMVAYLESAVELDQPNAMHTLGRYYFYGTYCRKDVELAKSLFDKAANKGEAKAMVMQGEYHYLIKSEYFYASIYYEKAKAKGLLEYRGIDVIDRINECNNNLKEQEERRQERRPRVRTAPAGMIPPPRRAAPTEWRAFGTEPFVEGVRAEALRRDEMNAKVYAAEIAAWAQVNQGRR